MKKTLAIIGAITLILTTTIVFSTTIPVPVQACNIGDDDSQSGVYVNGKPHGATNDNGRHLICTGEAEFPPSSGGARVVKEVNTDNDPDTGDQKCHGVATPSGKGQFGCHQKLD